MLANCENYNRVDGVFYIDGTNKIKNQ